MSLMFYFRNSTSTHSGIFQYGVYIEEYPKWSCISCI